MPPEPEKPQLSAQIQGFRGKRFECVGGFGGRIEVLVFKDGPDPLVRQQAGRTTYDSVTLQSIQTGAPMLWKWWSTAGTGVESRRTVTLALTDARGKALATWTLGGCWPRDWSVTPVDAAGRTAGYAERVTLVVENIELVS